MLQILKCLLIFPRNWEIFHSSLKVVVSALARRQNRPGAAHGSLASLLHAAVHISIVTTTSYRNPSPRPCRHTAHR